MTGPFELLDNVIHRGEPEPPEESTPEDVLLALDWSDDDSGQELVERAEAIDGATHTGSDGGERGSPSIEDLDSEGDPLSDY